ncbi:MAG: acetylxylan esterase [Planctomycetaceae bacterium]|nr:acetylxylan esterase [Planctomycetaceae bacterium]
MPQKILLIVSSCFLMLIGATMTASTQSSFVANYDESQVPQYTLPDPLKANDGTMVKDAETWRNTRRGEVLAMFEREMFGKTPEAAKARQGKLRSVLQAEKKDAFDGKATRTEVRLLFSDKEDGPFLDLLIYVPNKVTGAVPAFLGLNFNGNQTVADEPDILVSESWLVNEQRSGRDTDEAAIAKSRGSTKSRWPVEMILDRGYALAVGYYFDIDPDYDDGFQNGVHPLFYRDGQTRPDADQWGSIGAWAWGLSRALDYLETLETIDAKRVAVFGHSRLGKTSLWAGAQDERFALVVSNNSGCGGAAISRRAFGETVARINTVFPHWFCGNYTKYNENENAAPFDQHELIALIAPRPVYIASAEKDQWADPKGEMLAGFNADSVYRLLGTDGIGDAARQRIVTEKDGMVYDAVMPAFNEPIGATIGYHIRTGVHDVTDYDWQQYLDFADAEMK